MFTLPQLLHQVRERQGISARGLSLKAGLSDAYIGKIEAGSLEPSLRSFLAIMDALGLNNQEILLCLWAARGEYFPPIAA